MNPETVDLQFTYDRAEVISALRLSYRRSGQIIARAAIPCVGVVIGLIGIIIQSGTLFWYLLFLLSGVMLALYLLAYFNGARKGLKGHPAFEESCYVTISDEHIVFRLGDVLTQYKWSHYQEVWELPNSYLLWRTNKTFTLIPRRAFSSDEQERVFRSMMNNHLGELIKIHDGLIRDFEVKTEYMPKSLEPPDWR